MIGIRKQVVADWANELSLKSGRSPEVILDRGLGAQDFKINQSVEIKFSDGSTACFLFAFLLSIKNEKLLQYLRNIAVILNFQATT